MAFQNKYSAKGGATTSNVDPAAIELAQALLTQTIPVVWETVVKKMMEPTFQAEVAKVLRTNKAIQRTAAETGLNDMQLQWLAVQTVNALTKSVASGTGVQLDNYKPEAYAQPNKPLKQPAKPTAKKPPVTKLKTKPQPAQVNPQPAKPQYQAQSQPAQFNPQPAKPQYKAQPQPTEYKPQQKSQSAEHGFFDKLSEFSFEELADTVKTGSEHLLQQAERYELKEKSEKLASSVGNMFSTIKRKASLAYDAIKEDNDKPQQWKQRK